MFVFGMRKIKNDTVFFREFWRMFHKIEVFALPHNISRRTMYAQAFLSNYESQTKTGKPRRFIGLQNALRRKSIRNSWWTLFCEDVSRSQNNQMNFPHILIKSYHNFMCIIGIDDEWWIPERYESDLSSAK